MPIARRLRSSALIALWLLLPVLSAAETSAVGPEINAHYHGADPQRWESIFERSGREVFDRRFEILQALRVVTCHPRNERDFPLSGFTRPAAVSRERRLPSALEALRLAWSLSSAWVWGMVR